MMDGSKFEKLACAVKASSRLLSVSEHQMSDNEDTEEDDRE